MARRRIAAVAAAAFIAASLACPANGPLAADEWLIADPMHLEPGATLTLHLNAGERFVKIAERAFAAKDNERFELYHGNAYLNLVEGTHDGDQPFWSQPLDFEGEFLVVLTRAKQGSERERVWNFAKLLGRVGEDEEGSLHHRFMGQQLEMVLIHNPVLLKSGDEEIVQLYFETKALAGQTVTARHLDAEPIEVSGVTDARGVMRLRLPAGGRWLLSASYARPCKNCKDADTESFHAVYAFETGS